MKWQTASISLLLFTLTLLLTGALMKRLPGQQGPLFTPSFTGEDVQLGYYDLLSRQREVYDTSFVTRDKSVNVMLTSPNDNRFGLKVNLLQRSSGPGEAIFDLKPVYYADNHQDRMIKSILGYAWQKGVIFDTLKFGGEQVVITPSGHIISYP